MSETHAAPGDDDIRNDYLAGRGAAPQQRTADRYRALLANPEPTPTATPAPASAEELPIGKRILSAVGSFAYGLVKPWIEDPAFLEQSAAEQDLVRQKEQELGRPLNLRERLDLVPLTQSAGFGVGLGFAGGGLGKSTMEQIRQPAVPELTPEGQTAQASLAEQVRARLAGAAEPGIAPAVEPEVAPAAAETPAVSRETVAPEAAPAIAPETAPAAPPRDILRLGDPLEPAVVVRPTAREVAQAEVTLGRMAAEGEPTRVAGFPEEPSIMSEDTIHNYLAGARLDNPVKVNLERIGSGDDIADALAQVSKTIPAQAVQSNEATVFAADALGLGPEDFLRNYQGRQLDAAQTTAMRFVLDSSAQQLVEFAKAAREPLAPPEAQAQFLKAFSVHRSLQQYFENARAEAGRTLQAWQIMSQTRQAQTRAVGELLKNVNVNGDLSNLAENIADMDNPLQVNRLIAESTRGSGRDTLMRIMYNVRLSSPTTIVKKLTSDVGMAMWNLATRSVAAVAGPSGEVGFGEPVALLQGYLGALPEAIRAGGKAIKAGESQFWRDYKAMDGFDLSQVGGTPQAQAARIDQRFRLSALANGVPEPLEIDQPTKGMLGYIQSAMPTSWIGAADDFAKVWQYRANLRALAYRAADGDATEFGRLLDAPPQWLHQQAFNEALKQTFQEPLTGVAASMRDLVDKINVPVGNTGWEIPLGRIIAPFVKVPVNIARTAYRASPIPYLIRSPQIRAALANPGAERDILLAQMGLGTALSTGVLAAALNGNITGKGPGDPALNREWRAAGNQPYSLQLPGIRPIQLNQIEPMGLTLSAIADTINLMKFAKDEDNEKLSLSLAFGVGQAMLSKTYFEGASDFLEALAHPDPSAPRYTSKLIASFVPQGIQRLANVLDDWRRAHYDIMDGIEANLPFVRQGLPPARSLWGDPIKTQDAYLPFMSGKTAALFSPVPLGPKPEDVEPIDKWIWDNREWFPHESETQRGIPKVGRTVTYSGGHGIDARIQLEPQEYDRYQELAGNAPLGGQDLGAKDTLNALVLGNHPSEVQQSAWDHASPAERALMVRTVIDRFRGGAKQQLLNEFPDLKRAVEAGFGQSAQRLAQPASP